ncbi:hypothetical protein GIB67_030795 [Kingdonia uniflora]|uniref:TF-B3 domain-containing protein n=1 Tax=Kingdonia uniflora TaxID=39325 RepID=A0A7J7L322_9MAGN|nr:hypothetical protein GIB67_030795 [Kingdonia uniflora]
MSLLTVIPEASKAYSSSRVDKGFGLLASEALTKKIPPCRPTGIHEKIDHIRASTCAKKRAEEVQRNLDPKYPSIVRPLCSYNVGSSTNQLQHLPPSFYNLYLPNQDVTFTWVDEDTGDCKVKFKYASRRLGCGWRRFSAAQELVVGDAMVFHLVKPDELKVYIIREYSLSGVNKDFGLQDSEAPAMQNATCTPIRTHEKTELKCSNTLPFGTIPVIISDSERADFENNSRSSEVSGGVIFWGNFDRESFDVAVDGLRKNSELSNGIWTKYYELCRSQNVFLHGNLLKQNIKLVDGVISETVILANGIKSSKLSTFINDFSAWDRSLEGLEDLEMNVDFLCTKLQRLENLVSESEHERYTKKRNEALDEFVCMEEEWKRLDVVLLSLKRRAETHTQKFQEEVNAPW